MVTAASVRPKAIRSLSGLSSRYAYEQQLRSLVSYPILKLF